MMLGGSFFEEWITKAMIKKFLKSGDVSFNDGKYRVVSRGSSDGSELEFVRFRTAVRKSLN